MQITHTYIPPFAGHGVCISAGLGKAPQEEAGGRDVLTRLALAYVAERTAKGEINRRSATQIRYKLLEFAEQTNVKTPADVRRRHVERWLERPGLSPAYRRSRLSALRGFCRWCVLNGKMASDPTLGVTTPKVPDPAPRALPLDHARAVAAAADDTRTALCVSLMLQEACRRIEVARILVADIDFRKRRLTLRGKGGGGQPTRSVWISEETFHLIRRYMQERSVTNGPLIRSHKNPDRGLTEAHISHLVTQAMRAAEVKTHNGDGVTPHALRHTALTDMVDNGADVRNVQRVAGHRHLVTTERYVNGAATTLEATMTGRNYRS